MEKINFINDTTPALNATNLNKLQQNVEDVTGDLSDLETSAKNNLVEAINEAASTGSGGDTLPIYSIVDYDGDTVPSGYEEVNSYSTTEVKTGDTWIDGKPIYRKVLTGTLPTGSGSSNDFYLDTNAEVRKVSGFVKSIYNQWWPVPCTYSSAGYNMYLIVDGTVSGDSPINKFSIECGSYYNTSSKYFIIVEYTKTTD